LVPLDDRPEQPVARAEVVMERRRVLLPGRLVELPNGDPVDALAGEQALGGVDDVVSGAD
jgi:hypothetical protein